MDDWEKLKAELLEDPATRAAYEARKPAYEIAGKLIEIRTRLGISQRQLAAKAGMTQPEIARLESAQVQPNWDTLYRILGAVGAELDIKLRDGQGKLVRLAVKPTAPAAARRSRKPSPRRSVRSATAVAH